MLEIRNLTKSFPLRTEPVLDSINFKLDKEQFCIILGSNGSGKSTLLKTIMGEHRQDKGQIILSGKNISKMPIFKRASLISSVEQIISKGTIGEMSLLENLVLSSIRGRRPSAKLVGDYSLEMYKIVKDLGMGLERYLYSPMEKLSGGQRQIIATLMSGMSASKLLLLDEHTSALDPKSKIKLMRYTAEKIAASKIATIMVTHDLHDALEYGDRLVIMSHGRIIEDFAGRDKMSLTKDYLMRIFQSAEEGIH